jgi:hydrogenase expression/formation protein HypE
MSALTQQGNRLAITTDSFVVDPLEFPGGDIGKLAVCGTVNDLAVGGAVPLYLSCAAIIEEGLPFDILHRIARSMAVAARDAGVQVITGDTKVVQRGACDKLFLTTTGVGTIRAEIELAADRARPGDAVLVNGVLGDHGSAILAARGDMALDAPIDSDCAALHGLVGAILAAAPATRFMRDATRGGIATVLNEISLAAKCGIEIDEATVPLREAVRGFCEILGLDPLYLANEGRLVAIVPAEEADAALAAMHAHPLGNGACRIGQCTEHRPGQVVMHTVLGGQRIVDMLIGDQLPRIC